MLCDQSWQDPDLDQANGISMREEADMLRMDAFITNIQLNIRCLLEVCWGLLRLVLVRVRFGKSGAPQCMDTCDLALDEAV